jgi:hypothetical protein
MMIAEQLAGQALGIPPVVAGKAINTAEAVVAKTADVVEESTKRQVQINEKKAVADANKRLNDYLEGKSSYGGDPTVGEYVTYNTGPTTTFTPTTKSSSSTKTKKRTAKTRKSKVKYTPPSGQYKRRSHSTGQASSHSAWGGSHSALR